MRNLLASPRVRRWLAAVAATAALGVAAIASLHAPWARPLLRRVGGCPAARVTPEQVEAAQRRAWRNVRGSGAAPARPALGFALYRTTLAEVEAWARARGLACEAARAGALYRCSAVPASAIALGASGTYDDVAFGFRLSDRRLVNLTTLRTGLAPEDAAARMQAITGALRQALGGPAESAAGGAGPAYVAYRFADYAADVTSMRLPGRGNALREHYMAPLDGAGSSPERSVQ